MKKRVSIIALFLALMCVFSGCSKITSLVGKDEAKTPVSDFLKAVKKDDTTSAKSCLVNPDDYESLTDVAKNVGLSDDNVEKFINEFTKIKYNVDSFTAGDDGQTGTVIVTMTIPDYSPAFTDALSKIDAKASSEASLKTIMETLANYTPVAVQKAVAVNVVKSNDKWLIDYSNNNIELLNAVNGNLLSSLHGFLSV